MRFHLFAIGLVALFTSGVADAQGQQRPPARRPQPPPNTVAPIFVAPRARPAVTPVTPPLVPTYAWVLDLSNGGRVVVQLRPDIAPSTVNRIRTLTARGFYNGLAFHRVIDGFMAQGGDPAGNGTGESDLPDLASEFNDLPHLRGTVAMARTSDPNSANSQFYIMFVPRLGMDRDYTVFGRVVQGMNFVDMIQRGEPPAAPTRIVRATLGSDNAPPPTAEEVAALIAARTPAPVAAPIQMLNVPSLTGSPPRRPGTAPATRPATTSPASPPR